MESECFQDCFNQARKAFLTPTRRLLSVSDHIPKPTSHRFSMRWLQDTTIEKQSLSWSGPWHTFIFRDNQA